MLPVTDLIALSTACAKIANAGDALLDNGGLDPGDLRDIPLVFDAVRSAGDVHFGALLPEILDLDEAEAEQVAAHFRTVFHISFVEAEKVIEAGYAIVLDVVAAVNHWRSAGLKLKALKSVA